MLKSQFWLSSGYHKLITMTVPLAITTILGCSGGGESSPITSNIPAAASTVSDSHSAERDPLVSDVEPLPDDLFADTDAEFNAPIPQEATEILTAGSEPVSTTSDSADGQTAENPPPQAPTGIPVVTLSSTPAGASANVTWQPSPDSNVSGYYIYYGRQPSEEPGVCSYEGRYAVDSPSVVIMDLEPNTPYFFAVSSYSSYESPCSKEIATITPPAGA